MKPEKTSKGKTEVAAEKAKSSLSSQAFHGKRVRLTHVIGDEGLPIEIHELSLRIGKEGICDGRRYDGEFAESVTVLFDDGTRLTCLPEELEICDRSTDTSSLRADRSASRGPVAVVQPRFVQSCITHVSFPSDISELEAIIERDAETDMEGLLWPRADETDGGWTVPRWMTEGDILFFYHTLSAHHRIKRLIKQAEDPENVEWKTVKDIDRVINRLYEQLEIAERYSGTIFGCALITGKSYVLSKEFLSGGASRHWKGRIHAPYGHDCIFARPIPDYAFRDIVPISRAAAITPVHGTAFVNLKELLSKHNQLPDYLEYAVPGGVSFREVNSTNWIEIACSSHARFIDESQLRAYVLDYLLEELKDPKTKVHRECSCQKDGKRITYADYCLRVGGRWIVAEAKLNVRAESDLSGQVATYLNVASFCPNRGAMSAGLIKGPTAQICLVGDSDGIYLMDRNGYFGCELGRPIWPLKQLTRSTLPEIRERLILL